MKRFLAVAVSAALFSPAVVVPALFVEHAEVQAMSDTARRDIENIEKFLEKAAKGAIQEIMKVALREVSATARGIAKRTVDRMLNRIQGLDDPEVGEVIEVITDEVEEAGAVGDEVMIELVTTVTGEAIVD